MTPDEVRMLDNQYALLFIRGERPVKDLREEKQRQQRLIIKGSRNAADTWRADKNDRRVCCFTEWSQILQG